MRPQSQPEQATIEVACSAAFGDSAEGAAVAHGTRSLTVASQNPSPRPFRAVASRFNASPLVRWTERCAQHRRMCQPVKTIFAIVAR